MTAVVGIMLMKVLAGSLALLFVATAAATVKVAWGKPHATTPRQEIPRVKTQSGKFTK